MGNEPWDLEPRLEKEVVKKKEKKIERRTIFEDGVVALALDLGEREEVGV